MASTLNMGRVAPQGPIFVDHKKHGIAAIIVCRFDIKMAETLRKMASERKIPIAKVIRELVTAGLRKV